MAYLFVHFTSDTQEREAIWFSVSRDGLHWQDLGGQEPFLTSHLGTTGIRDPFMIYDSKRRLYVIMATDLKTSRPADWNEHSHHGSRSILFWESEDLVHWTPERAVELAVPEAGCAWAPEAIFCPEKGKWLIFFASSVNEKQRIYAAFTEDFHTFEPTFQYIEKSDHIIDTTITYDGDYYYRFSKEETGITAERSSDLLSPSFEPVYVQVLDENGGMEGPEIFRIKETGLWCLIADQYRGNKGYLPMLATDLAKGDFRILDPSEYDLGPRKKRHGGVIAISEEEYTRLIQALA